MGRVFVYSGWPKVSIKDLYLTKTVSHKVSVVAIVELLVVLHDVPQQIEFFQLSLNSRYSNKKCLEHFQTLS